MGRRKGGKNRPNPNKAPQKRRKCRNCGNYLIGHIGTDACPRNVSNASNKMRVESSSGAQPRYRNKNKDDYEQGNQPPEQSHLAQSPTFGEIRWRAPIISTQADTSPVLLLDNYQTSYLSGDQFTDTPSSLDYSLPETPPDPGTSAAGFLLSKESWDDLFCATFNQDVVPELMPEGMRNLSSELPDKLSSELLHKLSSELPYELSSELPDEPAQFEPGSMLGKN